MRKFLVLTGIILAIGSTTMAQDKNTQADIQNKVYNVVEQQPSFPGGPGALNSWLRENVKYPAAAIENRVQGRVIVQFIVECDGSISEIKVNRPVDPYIDKEALRVVSKMPKWIPGRQSGRPVRVRFFVPVTFRL